ncbi:MAG TPA: AtaL-like protein [Burkholderiaceae bacterium]|nr:AtaL-like protein [Burkholderiaceae bacterium]
MRFEHLIQINDPLMPLLDTLTREQLWRGLVLRAEEPTQFVPGLEIATIRSRRDFCGEIELVRTLDFGSFRVDDRVRLLPLERSEIHTSAGPTWPASRMSIAIEEPQPELLFLRFVYESDETAGGGGLDKLTVALREQAYERADVDTVARIRALAESGLLDADGIGQNMRRH